MTSNQLKPILVTGSHRSGSTWVGRILSASESVAYIHEPFHLEHDPGICSACFDYWFYYVCKENEHLFIDSLRDTIQLRYSIKNIFRSMSSLADAKRILKDYFLFSDYRAQHRRALVKDPLAFFSSAWLADRFNMDVVVLIRHPAAFAGSLKRANWTHPFSHFLQQPLLMRDYLSDFKTEIKNFADHEHDIIDQAILLWNIIHSTIVTYRETFPDWIYVRHEDLSREPHNEFKRLFYDLNVPFADRIDATIDLFSSGNNPSETASNESIICHSEANIMNWKHRLTLREIDRIKEKTEPFWRYFYAASDW